MFISFIKENPKEIKFEIAYIGKNTSVNYFKAVCSNVKIPFNSM